MTNVERFGGMMRAIGVLIAFLLCNTAPAADLQLSCDGNVTNIYFSNGVSNTRAEARASRNVLGISYLPWLQNTYPNERFLFGVAYNPTDGIWNDVKETLVQRNPGVPEFAQMTSGQLMAIAQMSRARLAKLQDKISQLQEQDDAFLKTLGISNPVTERAAAPNFTLIRLAEEESYAMQDELSNINRFLSLVGTNEAQQQLYRGNLLAGERVLIIAHSQGNLFSNDNVKTLIAEYPDFAGSIGIVGVATPAKETVNASEYVTAYDDRVIDALRAKSFWDVLPANIENDNTVVPYVYGDDPREVSNHEFVQSYFNDILPSRVDIDRQLRRLLQVLVHPATTVGSGAIRATLEWGVERDIDLHVYEPAPENTHVYYSQKQGLSGYLDLDDRNQYGPENYYVPCDQLRAGTYRFGVQYYAGTNPENVRLQLTTSNGQLTSATRLLSQAVGHAGDQTPQILITLDVEIGADGRVKFTPRVH